MYYLVLSITVTSSTTSPTSIVQKALTLLVDIGLGGSNYSTTTKKKATTTTTITDANIMIAIENLNKLSMALTSNLNSKILANSSSTDSGGRNTTNGIRINVDVCHYDDTDDVFYATRYHITLLKSSSAPLSSSSSFSLSSSQFVCMAGSFR
jgi:hypothetical protein